MKLFSNPPENTNQTHYTLTDAINFSERVGKFGTIILGTFYATGLIVFGAYYSNLHIRSIELFRVRYFFVGFYFCLFLYMFFVFPNYNLRRWWIRIAYYLLFVTVLMFMNDAALAFLNHKLSLLLIGDSYYKFTASQSSIIWRRISMTATLSLLALLFFYPALYQFRQGTSLIYRERVSANNIQASIFLLLAILVVLSLFLNSVFPNIPEALGGGKAPLITLEFKEGTPYAVSLNFDIYPSTKTNDYGYQYWARLVFVDSDSVFLQEAFWFADQVYEVRRDEIELIRYEQYNPVELGSPDLNFP